MLAEIASSELVDSEKDNNAEDYPHDNNDCICCFHETILAQIGWMMTKNAKKTDFSIDFYSWVWYNGIMDYQQVGHRPEVYALEFFMRGGSHMATSGITITIHGKKVRMSETTRCCLTGGPALLDLLIGYAYACPNRKTGRPTQWTLFKTDDDRVLQVRLAGMRHESNAENTHLIDCYVRGEATDGSSSVPEYEASGFFDTDRQTGYLDVWRGGPNLGR